MEGWLLLHSQNSNQTRHAINDHLTLIINETVRPELGIDLFGLDFLMLPLARRLFHDVRQDVAVLVPVTVLEPANEQLELRATCLCG